MIRRPYTAVRFVAPAKQGQPDWLVRVMCPDPGTDEMAWAVGPA
jgi:hypothetical protein